MAIAKTKGYKNFTTQDTYLSMGDVHGEAAGLYTIQVVGTGWTGTLTFQGSMDKTNYVAVACLDLNSTSSGLVTTATADKLLRVDASGLADFRIYYTTHNGGSVEVFVNPAIG